MTTTRTYSWALLELNNWNQVSDTFDTLLNLELHNAQARQKNNNEILMESAWIIRDNMLEMMSVYKKYGTDNPRPRNQLINNICNALNLPTGCLSIHYRDQNPQPH